MADNDNNAKLDIEVNAVANKSSAEKAGKEIVDGVNKAIGKKGHVEVSVDIATPIDKNKDKLTKAQNAIVKEINKMTKKGFVASGKDIDDLTSKFNTFTKTFDQAGKGRQNKVFREIRKQVEDLQKTYNKLKMPKQNNTKTKSETKSETAEDRYLKKQEKYSTQAKEANKRTELKKELGYVRKNKSLTKSSSNVSKGSTNDYDLRMSEISEYKSGFGRQIEQSRKEAQKTYEKKIKKDKYDTKEQLENELAKRHKTDTIKGKNSNKFTTQQKANNLSDDIRNNILPNLLDKAQKAKDDGEFEEIKQKFFDTLEAISKLNLDASKLIINDVTKTLDITMRKLGFKRGGKLGGTKGDTIDKSKNPKTESLLKGLLNRVKTLEDKIKQETIELDKFNVESTKSSKKSKTTEINSNADKLIGQLANDTKTQTTKLESTTDAINNTESAIENQTAYDKVENVAERVADTKEASISEQNKDINIDTAEATESDIDTGFNTDTLSKQLIDICQNILESLENFIPKEKKKTTEKIGSAKRTIQGVKGLTKKESIFGTGYSKYAIEINKAWDTLKEAINPNMTSITSSLKHYYKRRNNEISSQKEPSEGIPIEKSKIYASPIKFWDRFKQAIEDATGVTEKYKKAINATADEQDTMAAERIKQYGLNNGRNPNDTGDIANMIYRLRLYRANKSSIENNPDLQQKIKLTPGIEVDTTEVMKRFNKELSGNRMRNAQMGGSIPRQILGAFTGFIGMPSIEKSRAQADAFNQILSNVNIALNSVLTNIQRKETELAGLQDIGEAKINDDGTLSADSSAAAFKTLADLEEEKLVLQTILADMKSVDQIVGVTGKKFNTLARRLSFTSPVLRENNDIIRNINAGLDKGGKALKFQKRTGEILNYTFQLISRSIGQMLKRWIMMLNPINLIKKAFSGIKRIFNDFASYDPKWQRTLNVIKYNFRDIIRPFMQWIAQQLTNIIGFVDIISQKIQAAFGHTPISLFDQENAQKVKETYEDMYNISAGFDELHDVGTESSDNDPNNLLGEIYKPQLSEEWQKLANDIGDLFADVIKGDLGFGDALKRIGELLTRFAKLIWEDYLKPWVEPIWEKIKSGFWNVLKWILGAFLAWEGLKIFGPKILNALFGKLTESGISGVATKVGSLFGKIFSTTAGSIITGVLSGVILALNTIWAYNTAKDLTYNWNSLSTGEKVLGGLKLVAQDAIGALGGAGLGAAIGALGGPIGALGGAIIGLTVTAGAHLIGWATTSSADILDLADAQTKAKEALQLYEETVENATNVELEYRNAREQLTQLEKEAGITGEELAKQVENGTLSVHDMTDAQLNVFNAYIKVQSAMQQVEEWEKKLQEASKETVKANIEESLSTANTTKNWDTYKNTVIEAINSGKISLSEGKDYLERAMADMDNDTRKTFMENIPNYVSEGLDPNKHASAWRKFKDGFWEVCSSIGDWFSKLWHKIWNGNDSSNTNSTNTSVSGGGISGGGGSARSIKTINSFAVGTNYVPNDGLAYLHQGEAVVPKKYNPAYNDNVALESAIYNLSKQVEQINGRINQGINISGEFRQRGSDLVAVVNKTNSRTGADLLSNVAYAR